MVVDLVDDTQAGIDAGIRETWILAGKPHRDRDLPAVQIYDQATGALLREEWWRHGKRHRIGKPAVVHHGFWQDKMWYQDDLLHRVDGPAVVGVDKNGNVMHEEWRILGKQHRQDGPAWFYRNSDTGVVHHEMWYEYGLEHREDGPAEIYRDERTGKVIAEIFYRNGNLIHCLELGPSPPSMEN